MRSPNIAFIIKTFAIVIVCASCLVGGQNISCYQCVEDKNVECAEEKLLPCASIHDRCVTHITKDAKNGFTIKRECGLGPCGFNDVMVDKGLGFDKCDRSRDDYFCILCCKGNGCNKSRSSAATEPRILLILIAVFVVLVNLAKNFQPPYVSENK